MFEDSSLTNYVFDTLIDRMWQTQLNEFPKFIEKRNPNRSLTELRGLKLTSLRISGSWNGIITIGVDMLGLSHICSKLLFINTEITEADQETALLRSMNFVADYISVAIPPDLRISEPAILNINERHPKWMFGTRPRYFKCMRAGAGRFWIVLTKS